MAGRMIEHRGFVFEVWKNSLRLRQPKISPAVASYNDLTDDENAVRAMDDIIAIMNIGVQIARSRSKKLG